MVESSKDLEKKVGSCPFAKFEGWDLMICSYGDYICQNLLMPDDPGEFGGPGDRPICNEKDFLSCKAYQQAMDVSKISQAVYQGKSV
jgi:hypothetical protein